MKQRLTFFNPEDTFIDVKSIHITDNAFNYTASPLSASVEQRITWSLNELPKQMRSALKDTHELHVRWARSQVYEHLSPVVSRIPTGLHVFYTPRDGKHESAICPILQQLLDEEVDCDTAAERLSRPAILSERFASTASFQFYHLQQDLQPALTVLSGICSAITDSSRRDFCHKETALIASAAQVDLDFDIISHALVVTATWPQSTVHRSNPGPQALSQIYGEQFEGNIEIGILGADEPDEPEELKLGGYLTVLGEDSKPSATLFSFPSRHHPLPANDNNTFAAAFVQPTGLHPTLAITFPRQSLQPPRDTCALHTYLTLPSALFLDRYQLSEPALMASKNLQALHALSGAEDLEAPDWAVRQWGSASLLELRVPDNVEAERSWEVQIPLHLRYLQSLDGSSLHRLNVPWPIVFWACEAEEGLKMGTNPFDRVNLGYDGLFGPKTMFYHVPASGLDTILTLDVPVLAPGTGSWLPTATLSIVLAGIAWVLYSLLGPLQAAPQQEKNKKTQ